MEGKGWGFQEYDIAGLNIFGTLVEYPYGQLIVYIHVYTRIMSVRMSKLYKCMSARIYTNAPDHAAVLHASR